MRKHFLTAGFLFLIAFGLGWQLGMQVERRVTDMRITSMEAKYALSGSGVTFAEDPEKEVDMSILWTVWRLLDRKYVDPASLTIDKLRFGAVRGLVGALGDPYSAFMTPKENNDFQHILSGQLEGIGAELTVRDGQIVVVAPLKGTPAADAGLKPMDIIVSIDGTPTDGMDLQAVVEHIRGKKGTKVVIGIFRPSTSEKFDAEIVRDEIRVPSVESEIMKTETGSIGYVALNQFGDETVSDARNVLNGFGSQSLSGVILDLRFNGGGYLEGAIDVASFFLDTEKIVSVHRRGKEIEAYFAHGDPVMADVPLAVLINGGSASASEIVAGALQDDKRAKIIGMQSFGKGTVQEVIDLPGGSSLRVTVAKWKTPGGKELGREGVTPDIIVDTNMEDVSEGRDPQKAAAVEWLLDGEETGA